MTVFNTIPQEGLFFFFLRNKEKSGKKSRDAKRNYPEKRKMDARRRAMLKEEWVYSCNTDEHNAKKKEVEQRQKHKGQNWE